MKAMVIFEHPDNAAILAYLGRSWDEEKPSNLSAPPGVHDLHRNPLGTHPDVLDRLWKELTVKLPEPCAWVVYGKPVLVHPSTGVVFGFAGGTLVYALRLPDETCREALEAGATRVHAYGTGERLDLADLGPGWVLGRWLAAEPEWCLAAYRMAGARQ
jgi:hypothetical protein